MNKTSKKNQPWEWFQWVIKRWHKETNVAAQVTNSLEWDPVLRREWEKARDLKKKKTRLV